MDDLAFAREAFRRELVELLVKIDKASQNDISEEDRMRAESRIMHGMMDIMEHTFRKYGMAHSRDVFNNHPEQLERAAEFTGLDEDQIRNMMEDL